MKSRKWFVLVALVILAPFSAIHADDDDEVAEFDELEIFFEFNATDLDLGIQVFVDAPAWEELEVEGPDGEIFEIEGDGELGDLGLTEFTFESAEPPLVADPDMATEAEIAAAIQAFLNRFPEGEYEFSGETVDGRKLHGVADLTHDLLDEPALDISAFPIVMWVPDPNAVEYEVVVEAEVVIAEEEHVFVNTATLNPVTNVFTASPEFLLMLEMLEEDLGAEVEMKVELICKEESGNKTSTEQELEED